jgi:type IV pilus assembly protein PilX
MPNPDFSARRYTHLDARFGVCINERERGYVMVVSLLILLLITVMSITMARSFFLEEGMAGNLREKNRSFAAAQAALRYGEWYASQGGTPASCSTLTGAITAQLCTNAVTVNATPNASTPPLATYISLPTSAYLSVATGGGKDTFYAQPGFYVQFIGLTLHSVAIYQITAFGYGGSLNSVSVVQSTYQVCPGYSNMTNFQQNCK